MTQKPWAMVALSTLLLATPAEGMEKLGRISPNPFLGDGTANPFSMYNNRFNPNSPYNRFGPYGNRFSPYSAYNPFATNTPEIYGHANDGYGGNDYLDSGGEEDLYNY